MKCAWIGAAESDDVSSVAVGFFGADSGYGVEFGDCCGTCDDEIVKDAVAEDDEGGFAGFCGFVLAPVAEIDFEGFLFGGVGGGSLFAVGFQGGFGGFRAAGVAGFFSPRRRCCVG